MEINWLNATSLPRLLTPCIFFFLQIFCQMQYTRIKMIALDFDFLNALKNDTT